MIGLVLGVTQFRKSTPFSVSKSIRYQGWMRWHYISGVLFGVFALTWVFSGLLSMEPFDWTSAEGLDVRARCIHRRAARARQLRRVRRQRVERRCAPGAR